MTMFAKQAGGGLLVWKAENHSESERRLEAGPDASVCAVVVVQDGSAVSKRQQVPANQEVTRMIDRPRRYAYGPNRQEASSIYHARCTTRGSARCMDGRQTEKWQTR